MKVSVLGDTSNLTLFIQFRMYLVSSIKKFYCLKLIAIGELLSEMARAISDSKQIFFEEYLWQARSQDFSKGGS